MNGNEVFEQKFNDSINRKINDNPKYETLRGFANYVLIKRSYTTVDNYLSVVLKFLKQSGKLEKELSLDDYINYISGLRRKTSSYQILVYSALKKFSEYLFATKINDSHHMENIDRPKFIEGVNTKSKREKGYLTEEEIKEYINNITNGEGRTQQQIGWKERDLAIVMILLSTGMRCSAAYKLNVDSINFDKKYLLTVDKEQRVEQHYLSNNVIDVLKQWVEKRNIILDGKEEDALFISNRKTRMTPLSIANVIKKNGVIINDKNITPHKLRATYGTQIYNKTHDIYLVQKCMGHSSPQTSELYIRGEENKSRKNGSKIMDTLLF